MPTHNDDNNANQGFNTEDGYWESQSSGINSEYGAFEEVNQLQQSCVNIILEHLNLTAAIVHAIPMPKKTLTAFEPVTLPISFED